MMQLFRVEKIENMEKKFGCIAVDLTTSSPVSFTQGDLRSALRASVAIPGIFTPEYIGDKILVDGGVAVPIPISLVKELGADFVVAVDLFGGDTSFKRFRFKDDILPSKVSSWFPTLASRCTNGMTNKDDKKTKTQVANLIEIMINTSEIAQRTLADACFRVDSPDFILRPQVGNIGIMDFHKAREGILAGEQIAEATIDELKAKLAQRSTNNR